MCGQDWPSNFFQSSFLPIIRVILKYPSHFLFLQNLSLTLRKAANCWFQQKAHEILYHLEPNELRIDGLKPDLCQKPWDISKIDKFN